MFKMWVNPADYDMWDSFCEAYCTHTHRFMADQGIRPTAALADEAWDIWCNHGNATAWDSSYVEPWTV